jgi:glycosyltransferase involved in cell wall biosynthesis
MKAPMKILFCNYEYPPLGGGGGVVMAALAKQLAQRHDVTVLTSRAGQLPSSAFEDGVRVIRVPVFFRRQLAVANLPSMFAYLPSGFVRGLRLDREHRFDVINTHFVVPTGPLGHALSRLYRVPNIVSVHGGDLFDPSKGSSPHRHATMRGAVRWLLNRADGIVGQSRDTVRHVSAIYGVDRPVELIPLGIERPPPPPAATRNANPFDLPSGAFVMATVGRLVPRKAIPQLIDVIAATKLPNAHLLIVGGGPESQAIAERARAHGIERRIRLLGQTNEEDKYAALRMADVFVTTSQHEGFGLVFLEAMAQGLPIICYDRGGQTDFLRTGETGVVVPLNDQARFRDAILALHSAPDARRRYGQHNLARVEEFFIDTCAARYERIFERAILARAQSAKGRSAMSSSEIP